MTVPDEQMPPDDRREALRARLLSQTPWWYSPWAHLGATTLFGLAIIAVSLATIRDLRAVELLIVPVTYLVSNAAEWRAHKSLLHRRLPFAPVLYDRHTPEHHMIYVTGDMSIRSTSEFRLVLIPAYGILLIFLGVGPGIWGFWHHGWHNVACLFAITTMAFVVMYEWLHLSFHLAPGSFIGRLRIIRILRKHHATHHDPRLMQRWNFNVTVPLWDYVRGTVYRPEKAVARRAEHRATP